MMRAPRIKRRPIDDVNDAMNQTQFNRDDNERDQLADDLAAYALGALTPAERRVLDAQIQASPQLQTRLRALSTTVDALAYSAPQLSPPPAAKARLLARVEADRRKQASASPRARPISALGARQPGRNRFRQVQQQAQRQAQSWLDLATGWKLTTLATASALLIFVAASYSLQRQLTQLSSTLATVQAEVTTLRTSNAELQQTNEVLLQEFQAQRLQLASLVNIDQVVTLDGREVAPNAGGTLFVGTNSLTLLVHGLKPLPAGQTYELWLIPDGRDPIASGLVSLTAAEGPYLITDLPRNAETFAAVGLTIEPAGGSDQPTGPIVLLGTRTAPS